MSKRRFTNLLSANRQLSHLNCERQKRSSELSVANEELIFQNKEKEKRAAELIIANIKLTFENIEKGNRATELALAYSELRETEENQKRYIIELEKMLFMISHEVRQPLTQILGLSYLVEQLNQSDPLKSMLLYLRQSATQLDVFTKKFTNYLHTLVQRTKENK